MQKLYRAEQMHPNIPATVTFFEFSGSRGLLRNAKFPSEAHAEPERKPGLIPGFSTTECFYSQLSGTTNEHKCLGVHKKPIYSSILSKLHQVSNPNWAIKE